MIEGTINTIIIVLFGLIIAMMSCLMLFIAMWEYILEAFKYADEDSSESQTESKQIDFDFDALPKSKKIASYTFFALTNMVIGFLIYLTYSDIIEMNWPAFLISLFSTVFVMSASMFALLYRSSKR